MNVDAPQFTELRSLISGQSFANFCITLVKFDEIWPKLDSKISERRCSKIYRATFTYFWLKFFQFLYNFGEAWLKFESKTSESRRFSFSVRVCILSRRSLHVTCLLLNSCSLWNKKGHRKHAEFGLLRDPLFLGPRKWIEQMLCTKSRVFHLIWNSMKFCPN